VTGKAQSKDKVLADVIKTQVEQALAAVAEA
jgi:hypothetical protein